MEKINVTENQITNLAKNDSSHDKIELEDLKKSFTSQIIVCSVKVKKEDTQKILKVLKDQCIKYKNINPVNKVDEKYNTIRTAHQKNEIDKLKEFLNKNNFEFEYELLSEEINLTYDNYNYLDIMKKISPEEVPNSYEIIGKIAHLNLREKFLPIKHLIGQIIIDKNPGIKTVINKTSKIDNVFRTYEMEVLSGEEQFEVSHKEGSCTFEFDIRKVYWCSRLQAERDRVLKMFKKGDVLCDAFCGVGPLAIRAAKQGQKVLANDLNPNCFEYINKNIKKNKIDPQKITTFNMDAREFIRCLIDQTKHIKDEEQNFDNSIPCDVKIDHIYMNLPKDALEFLDVFVGLFKNTKKEIYNKNTLPTVHVYGFSNARDPEEDIYSRIAAAFGQEQFDSTYVKDFHMVRDVSNNKHMFCVSFGIPPEVGYK